MDTAVSGNMIEQLFHNCEKWPKSKSILVMDDAFFHYSEWVEPMFSNAGVKLVYLPPYSPDLNPIEEFFAELKNLIVNNIWILYSTLSSEAIYQTSKLERK